MSKYNSIWGCYHYITQLQGYLRMQRKHCRTSFPHRVYSYYLGHMPVTWPHLVSNRSMKMDQCKLMEGLHASLTWSNFHKEFQWPVSRNMGLHFLHGKEGHQKDGSSRLWSSPSWLWSSSSWHCCVYILCGDMSNEYLKFAASYKSFKRCANSS